MNKTTIYSTIIASTIAVLAVFAFSSSEVEAKPPSSAICPAENVQHWYSYAIGLSKVIEHATEPSISDRPIFTYATSPDEFLDAVGAGQRIADNLNSLGYFVNDPTPRPVEANDVRPGIASGNIAFTTICAKN